MLKLWRRFCAHILTMRAKPHGGHAVETMPCDWTRARVRLHTEGSSPAAVPMWPAIEGPAKYQGLPPGNARNPAPSSRAHSAWGRVHTAPTRKLRRCPETSRRFLLRPCAGRVAACCSLGGLQVLTLGSEPSLCGRQACPPCGFHLSFASIVSFIVGIVFWLCFVAI